MASAEATRLPPGLLDVRRPFSPVQWAAFLGALAVLVWSVPGLIANPDFAVGEEASSVRVLGVDMNGWHAVAGFLVAIPALLAARRPNLAAIVCLAAGTGLVATAVWALLDTQLAGGLLYFPNNEADARLHVGTASIFLAGAAHYFLVERSVTARAR
jgi:hypothetical protein